MVNLGQVAFRAKPELSHLVHVVVAAKLDLEFLEAGIVVSLPVCRLILEDLLEYRPTLLLTEQKAHKLAADVS